MRLHLFELIFTNRVYGESWRRTWLEKLRDCFHLSLLVKVVYIWIRGNLIKLWEIWSNHRSSCRKFIGTIVNFHIRHQRFVLEPELLAWILNAMAFIAPVRLCGMTYMINTPTVKSTLDNENSELWKNHIFFRAKDCIYVAGEIKSLGLRPNYNKIY